MKKWLQNLSSAVIASLLAITLSGKAYANAEDQTLPNESPTVAVEASEPVPVVTGTASAPAPEPAPASESVTPVVPVAETNPVAAAVPAAVEAVPDPVAQTEAPAIVLATPEAPAESLETAVAAPEVALSVPEAPIVALAVAETPAEEPVVPEASVAAETPVVAENQTKIPAATPEVTAVETEAPKAEEGEAFETPIVETGVDETEAENLPERAPVVQNEEIPLDEKDERTVTAETDAVVVDMQQPAGETIPEKAEQPVQEADAEEALFTAPIKQASAKKLTQTRSASPSGDESDDSVNLLSEPKTLMRTASLEENAQKQAEGQSKEQTDEASTRGAKSAETVATSAENSLSQTADGSYVLVNHRGTETLSAEGDITVMAAGLNRVSSISGTGTVRIAGTGILLVDSIDGNVQLLTLTDIYQSGSVALFVKESEGRYVLRNGTVPGILDEDYLLEGVTLIMPDQTSLLLCGTGAEPIMDENGNVTSVNYYHGTDHDYDQHYVEYDNIIEHVGKLTIAKQAALIVQQGASVVLENLKSLSYSDYVLDIKYPKLIVTDGSELTVDGSVNGGGSVTIDGENSVLSGSGSMSASVIAMDATILNSSDVSLSNAELHIRNTEPIQNLKITDCTLIPERIVTTGANGNAAVEDSQKHLKINGLETAGNCSVVLTAGSDLVLKSVDGTLTLKTRYEPNYQVYDDPVYDDDKVIISVSGSVAGSGTIRFESGYYALEPETALNNVQIQQTGGYHVYDYTGKFGSSLFPLLCVQTEQMKSADNNEGKIPVAVAMYSYNKKTETMTLEELHGPSKETEIIVWPDINDARVLTTADLVMILQEYINQAADYGAVGASVEFLHKNNGRISTSRYEYFAFNYSDLIGSNEPIPMGDVCLIRIKITPPMSAVEPVTAATQTGTSFTGSGILGGSSAGMVNLGNATIILSPEPELEPEPEPEPTPDPGNDMEDSDLVPLVAYVEGAPEVTPLIWVKPASAANGDAVSLKGTQYVVLALEGEKTLEELGGRATVTMEYTPPAEYAGKTLYVVFRNEDGTLTAIPATWSTGLLSFITDRLGTFMVVGLDFDIEKMKESPEDFYKALAQIPELKDLVFAEYNPV